MNYFTYMYSCTSKTEDKVYVLSPYSGFARSVFNKKLKNRYIHVITFYKL